jgi:hypothetical protein
MWRSSALVMLDGPVYRAALFAHKGCGYAGPINHRCTPSRRGGLTHLRLMS